MKIKTVELNWKTPSEKKIYEFLENFDDEKKKSFSEACIEEKDDEIKMNRKNAKKWLTEQFDGTDYITWINRPSVDGKKVSAVQKMAGWKNL